MISWDWWGYSGHDYLFKTGVQLATVNNMVNWIFEGEPKGTDVSRLISFNETEALII